jgi:glycosyltransferase involved in cell wall biosynthesis
MSLQAPTPTSEGPAAADRPTAGPPLRWRERLGLWWWLRREHFREYLKHDSLLARKGVAWAGLLGGFLLRACGRRQRACRLWAAVHRQGYSRLADRIIEARFRDGPALHAVSAAHVAGLAATPRTVAFVRDPARLLGTRALVLKSPGANERGVLLLDYSFSFPLFAAAFDVKRIAERYYFVLEPSWSGSCELDILCYAGHDFPAFVEAYEPRDAGFLRATGTNLVPVPTAANWWVDHRVFRPLAGVRKDVDVIMVASWAHFKRHHRLLAALARLRGRGHRLKTVLVGYHTDFPLENVRRLAQYYGVADQVELHERLPAAAVNELLNRSKVNVLWSRREGINRAIIEAMFAGVPCVVREGFNYGYRYPYINEHTGCFVAERDLPDRLLEMVRDHERFAPRDWVMENLSCQKAAAVLDAAIGEKAKAAGERWTRGLAVKVCHLDAMQYWDEEDRQRFAPDYDFLRSCLRRPG